MEIASVPGTRPVIFHVPAKLVTCENSGPGQGSSFRGVPPLLRRLITGWVEEGEAGSELLLAPGSLPGTRRYPAARIPSPLKSQAEKAEAGKGSAFPCSL